VPPTLVRPTGSTLEGGRRSPQRGADAYSAPAQDHAVTSDQRGASPPSPLALSGHPGHCNAIPDIVEAWGDKTPPRPLLCLVRPPVSCTLESAHGRRPNGRLLRHHPRSRSWTDTRHAMTPRQGQDSQGRPSTPQLHAIPSHVARIVWHACKLPPPWPIKGGADP
jgi:hypothetical protein